MTSQNCDLKDSANFTHEIKRWFCYVDFCRDGPFSMLELKHHYERKHYQCSVARTLAKLTVKLQGLKEAKQ